MRDALDDLYQELILDHNRQPRNRRPIDSPGHVAEGYNPLCGDRVTVYLDVEGGRVADASFTGKGCAISTAAASMMTEAVRGKTLAEVHALFDRFRNCVTAEGEADGEAPDPALGKLGAFAGVRAYPMRVKCATLPWHALEAALRRGGTVSTE
jgi:nitrogen fixation NifU-like protein